MEEEETKKQSNRADDGSHTYSQGANDQCNLRDDLLTKLTLWLHRPCDPSSLGFFRILFGLLMIHDLMNERFVLLLVIIIVMVRIK